MMDFYMDETLGIRKATTFLMVTALIALAGACTPQSEGEEPGVPDDVDVRPDVVFSVTDGQLLNVHIESQGVVEPSREVSIRPRVSGYLDHSILEDGIFVQEGDTLLALDRQEWEYQLQQAENGYEEAQAEYSIEWQQRGGPDAQHPANRLMRVTSGLAQAELELERAKLELSYTSIQAPFTGYLSVPNRFSPGSYLTSGEELGRLVDDRTVRVRLDVLESELNRLESGMSVQVEGPDGTSKEGVIRSISPVVDPDRKSGQVLVEIDNSDRRLLPGMTVQARIRVESHSGRTRVPRSAILERDGGRTLLFRLNGNQVDWIYVDPVHRTSEWAIINHEDLSPGDTVAVDQHFTLSHQQQVRVRMAGEIDREEPVGGE
ncbi:MAG: efflux RND transporter periplasmic adaptor subunit [Balneolaceae bacterium]